MLLSILIKSTIVFLFGKQLHNFFGLITIFYLPIL